MLSVYKSGQEIVLQLVSMCKIPTVASTIKIYYIANEKDVNIQPTSIGGLFFPNNFF